MCTYLANILISCLSLLVLKVARGGEFLDFFHVDEDLGGGGIASFNLFTISL
jgi:hypothetical protein